MTAMPVTEMAAYEDDDTRLEFDVESDLPSFLSSTLRELTRFPSEKKITKLWSSTLLLLIER